MITLKMISGFCHVKEIYIGEPQKTLFGTIQLIEFLKKPGETFGLQQELVRKDLAHKKLYEHCWEVLRN